MIRFFIYTFLLITLLGVGLVRVSAQNQTIRPGQAKPAVAAAEVVKASPCSANTSGKLLLVSISKQHLWACDNQQLSSQSDVTTGKTVITNGVDDNTPTGSWQITGKTQDIHLRGSDANGSWDDTVKYWMPFNSDIGFHDSAWQSFPYGSDKYHTDGSHGCVHVPLSMMSWVYSWAAVGTRVTVQA